MRVRAVALGLGLAASAAHLGAQVINGALMRADGTTPATGVIVVASGPASDSALARAITGGSGRYAIAVPAGQVRLRALRIGHRPFAIGTFTLAAGATREVRTVLPDDPIVLQVVTTRATTACRQTGTTGAAVAAVFEEARKALLSTTLTSSDGDPMARLSEYAQVRSLGGRALSPLTREFKEGGSLKPFQSLPAESLAKVGYMQSDPSGMTYWAPDADVLLSETFAASHCLSLVEGTGEQVGWIGLTFRPEANRQRFVDVRGTLWLDRATSELRRMEFRYDGLPIAMQRVAPGGNVEFTRLTGGTWFVSKWEILMPADIPSLGSTRRASVMVKGGEVWRMRRGNDLLFTNGIEEPTVEPVGAEEPAKAAEAVEAAAAHASCEPTPDGTAPGVLRGTVRDEVGAALADAVVTVEWQKNHRRTGRELRWNARSLTTFSWAGGAFAVCGIPDEDLLEVSALFGQRQSEPVKVRIARDQKLANVDLRIDSVRAGAPVDGVVVRVRDIAGRPIRLALVEVEGGRGRVTDDSGRVALSAAPDSLQVIVRRMGFTPFDGRVGRNASGEFPVLLPPLAHTLGTVTVRGRASSALEGAGFYDRMFRSQRGAFVSDFMTPEELDARPVTRVTDWFTGRRFVGLNRTRGNRPQTRLLGRGGCRMTVYLDGKILMPEAGEDGIPIDDIIDAQSVAAIEIYASAANAPAELIPLGGVADQEPCGIVAIWTGGRT